MIRSRYFALLLILAAVVLGTNAQAANAARARVGAEDADSGIHHEQFTVEGVAREALIYAPPKAKVTSTPVVFVFHGHGGTARQFSQKFPMHRLWPQAISVYMQGLNTPGKLLDPTGKRPGWQSSPGDQGGRDLKFFDAVLQRLKAEYKVDPQAVYCTGHSNGGVFVYVLWAARPQVIAAVAPSGSAALDFASSLTPKPAMLVAGDADPLVKTEWQRRMMEIVRRINRCRPDARDWREKCRIYTSDAGAPLVTFLYNGGHKYPDAVPKLIADFFRMQNSASAEKRL